MTDKTKAQGAEEPEALRMARDLEALDLDSIAAELRRLHALTASQPVAPAGWTPGQPITEAMHVAAVKVLHRAAGVDGLPQRMLDAMIAAACETCRGHGMIGGPSFNDPGEGGVPCPDCTHPARSAARSAVDQDGAAFRTAAHLGLTLRFYGGCAQSSMPGTPSAYEVVTGQDRATAMREAVERAEAVIAAGGKPLTVAPLPMPDLTILTERGAAAWAGVEAQALREGRDTPTKQSAGRQPSPTPQADSQPAPVLDYPPLPNFDSGDEPIWDAIFNWKTATPGSDAHRKANAVESAIIDQLRAYVDADRAARAPADSVTAPAGGAVAAPSEILALVARYGAEFADYLHEWRGNWTTKRAVEARNRYRSIFDQIESMLAASPTPPAQAADSVLEDAARYRALRDEANQLHEDDISVSDSSFTTYFGRDLDEAVDALVKRAARKQGGA